ncbi:MULTISPECIES: hypothetical protein [unclassified Agrobacterium]|uniref:hypothetical protein n=1 Tax=unclassified Agrobacterium TaxID=2632611 RepID=UPI0024498960|nr:MULTISPECIES: hypothetical protein [unclassified Agrobacterium]MDH0612092.1 hypothetical protein [Agrobacterium sp. GD03872]MDH0695989.1 hypothetical protein [Agrobacterium sp. GD03871]MDH1058737.1 hypothetical protein [Agrobacterium sp. GD03992]MDH2210828.1 hypothetical protein [Agrobacterium sp. GD03643]MDH2217755.1 hypothetical protein [Agrobacterium sp. GD03638]
MRRVYKFLVGLSLAASLPAFAAEQADGHGIMRNVASCVGKFEAANSYASYVDGFTASKAAVEASFTELSRIMRLADNRSLPAEIAGAREEFQTAMWNDPVYIRSTIRAMEADCARQIAHVQEFKAALDRKDAQAEAVLKEERVARQKLDAEIALKEQERKILVARTENERAVVERIRIEEAAKERDFVRAKELAALDAAKAQASQGENRTSMTEASEGNKTGNVSPDVPGKASHATPASSLAFSIDEQNEVLTCAAFYMQYTDQAYSRKIGEGLVYMVILNGGNAGDLSELGKALNKRIAKAILEGTKETEIQAVSKHCTIIAKKYETIMERQTAQSILDS